MVYETDNRQPVVNVMPSNGGYGNNGGNDFLGGFGGGGIFIWLIIFFFMMMFMGWNNNGNASGNNGGTTFVPYAAPMMMGGGFGGGPSYCGVQDVVQQGFDQAAVISGITGVQNAVQQGFSNAEVSRCNQQANLLAQMNNNQNATNSAMNSLAMGLQNCCCENRQAVAQLGYNIATEACADRQAVNDAMQALTMQNNANFNSLQNTINGGIQSIKDQMCNDKIDAKNERIADLERQVTMNSILSAIAANQNSDNAARTAQTTQLLADNALQTANLKQMLDPSPIPAYIVQNPSCCNQNYSPCGCNSCCGR